MFFITWNWSAFARLTGNVAAGQNDVMKLEDAAKYLGVHPDTVRRKAIEEGKIAYSKLGEGVRAPVRFLKKDLDKYLQECRVPTVNVLTSLFKIPNKTKCFMIVPD
jgi:excisionase family DNA binding protein